MGFLVFLLLLAVIAGGLFIRARLRRDQVERVRDRARIKVIEGQLAMLRTALRVGAAEHLARRRMHEMHDDSVFTNSTAYEEPEAWQS